MLFDIVVRLGSETLCWSFATEVVLLIFIVLICRV